ncbi:ABC transporter ATP-binding protein/permease [Actinomyces israelii]|uniref:ABC transporter ATP-binding protein/permease n=1 Tax=Actinomyces israelii TaxID=1659 RepID=UPI0005BAFD6D|nr:ABC transporter ATP-binding protein/permease [Actinomyces israelii]
MLELRRITKSYRTASLTQTALAGVTVSFRDNEFVAVLGQSGSGKTTLLNVVGGLDHFDSGDLVIDDISTKDFKDRDWDAYRNNRIGFVFQSYNLIPHQSVLANVELALTLSGAPRAERRRRALDALAEVGLAEHAHKRPAQLSGGQMQRVAIARALINDPEIVLADEPTGALDSATSVQVMDLLKEIARDRLVIMVTHNPELARRYATRIVELADGRLVADSRPCAPADDGSEARAARTARATSMGPLTALALSFSNLMTKKGRTLMTSFAGSIGIIGIALILALANGVNAYIARTEEETLTSYPLAIQKTGTDMTAVLARGRQAAQETATAAAGSPGTVTTIDSFDQMMGSRSTNDLASLKQYLDSGGGGIRDQVTSIEYLYDVTPQIYLPDTSSAITRVNPEQAFEPLSGAMSTGFLSSVLSMDTFHQMPAEPSLYEDQYDVVAGRWPAEADELALVLDEDGTLPDIFEYTLGLRDHSRLDQLMRDYLSGRASGVAAVPGAAVPGAGSPSDPAAPTGATTGPGGATGATAPASPDPAASATPSADPAAASASGPTSYSYDRLMQVTFKLVPASARYRHDDTYGVWTDRSDDTELMRQAVADGEDLRITGIVRARDSDKMTLKRGLAYTPALTRHVMDQASGSAIVQDQLAHPDTDVLTGKTFADEAAGAKAGEIDLSSLFTVDTDKIQAAFQLDPSKLDLDLSGMDVSGFEATGIGDVDLSGLDLSALTDSVPEIDLSGLDLSSVSSQDLTGRFPQLADVDYPALIRGALADGALREGASTAVSTMMTGVIAGFQAYYAQHISDDPDGDGRGPDLATLAADYLAQPDVQKTIADTLGSDQVIDSARLTQNLVASLGADPDVGRISDAVRDELVTAIGRQVAASVTSTIVQTLSSSIQAALNSAMTQMMTAIQEQIRTAMQDATTRLATQMGSAMDIDEQAFKDAFSLNMDQEDLAALMASMMSTDVATYDKNLADLGWADPEVPSEIDLYPASFTAKERVKAALADYNTAQEKAGAQDRVITYTDLVGLLMSSVTRIVDIISWLLIAFVSISLVVSSIMIAIITYISVLERKKEIGILRSVGASKRDIRHVFNAETVIEGLLAGAMGVGITLLVCIPANLFVERRFGVATVAQLPATAGAALIGVSVLLTVLAGLVPAARAAREDPVEALRSE